MWKHIENAIPNCFADDLACVIGGMMGVKYTSQCLDLEMKLKKLFEYLEYYAILFVQPINYKKTEWIWTARAIGGPKFEICMGGNKIELVRSFRYLGYHISSKLGWSKMISIYKTKIRQRVGILRNCRICGTSSTKFKRVMFDSYVRPLFTWLFSIYPLFTECQRDDLGHFYYTCLKRTLGKFQWSETLFAALYEEKSLENHCHKYWNNYKKFLSNSSDGYILYEQMSLNLFRHLWLEKEIKITNIYRSKRFVPYASVIERCLKWVKENVDDSIPMIPEGDLYTFTTWPESFM